MNVCVSWKTVSVVGAVLWFRVIVWGLWVMITVGGFPLVK